MAPPAEVLPPDEVHLWHLDPREEPSAEQWGKLAALLTSEEQLRRERFLFERGRRQFLLARAVVRNVLSAYAPEVAPGDWRFGVHEHGRPFLLTPHPLPDLEFNLSHTDGSIVCAVTRGVPLGVDVEQVKPERDLVKLADRFFSAPEAAALRALAEPERPRRFYEVWTLKEAYIKARGLGLALPLAHFSFELGPEGCRGVHFEPSLRDSAPDWQFALLRLHAGVQAAVALKRGKSPDRAVRVRPVTWPA